jgi:hypothetical protein
MPDGHVHGLEIESNTLPEPDVVTCITQLIERWQFPRPQNGPVDVHFPFVFQSTF